MTGRAAVFPHRLFEHHHHLAAIDTVHGNRKLRKKLASLFPGRARLDRAHDHRVLGPRDVAADQELLVELLPRPQSRILDFDVAVGIRRRREPTRPVSLIIRLASSSISTGWPMSSTKTSPPVPIEPAWSTSCAASGIVMKKRRTSRCVTVTGPPRRICSSKSGTTDPEEPSTLPNRTMQKRVRVVCVCSDCSTTSARRLVAPITFVGLTALSVEIRTKVSTPTSSAASAAYQVLKTLL